MTWFPWAAMTSRTAEALSAQPPSMMMRVVKSSLHAGCVRVLRHQIFRGGIGGVAGGIFFGFHECMMGACRENYGKKNDNDSGKKVFKTHHKDSFELIGLFFAFYINREQKECKGVVTT